MAAEVNKEQLLGEVKMYLQTVLVSFGSEGTTFPKLLRTFKEEWHKELTDFSVKLGHGEGNQGVMKLLQSMPDEVTVVAKPNSEMLVKVVPNEMTKSNLVLIDKTNMEKRKEEQMNANRRARLSQGPPVPLSSRTFVPQGSTSANDAVRLFLNRSHNRPAPPPPPKTKMENPNLLPLGPRRPPSISVPINQLSESDYEREMNRCKPPQNGGRFSASTGNFRQSHNQQPQSTSRQIVRNDFGDVLRVTQPEQQSPKPSKPQTQQSSVRLPWHQPQPQPAIPMPVPPPMSNTPQPQQSRNATAAVQRQMDGPTFIEQVMQLQNIGSFGIDDIDFYDEDFRVPASRSPSPEESSTILDLVMKEEPKEEEEETQDDILVKKVEIKANMANKETAQNESKGEEKTEDTFAENNDGEDDEEDEFESGFEFDAEFEEGEEADKEDNTECTSFAQQQQFKSLPGDIYRLVALFRRNGGSFTSRMMDDLAKAYMNSYGTALNFVERNRLLDSPKTIRIVKDSFNKSSCAPTKLFHVHERSTNNYNISLQPSLIGGFVEPWPKALGDIKLAVGTNSANLSPTPSVVVKQSPPTSARSSPAPARSIKPGSVQGTSTTEPSTPLIRRVIVLKCMGGNRLTLQVVNYADKLAEILKSYQGLLESLNEPSIQPPYMGRLVLFQDRNPNNKGHPTLCRGRLERLDGKNHAIVQDLDTLDQRYSSLDKIYELDPDFPMHIFPPMAFWAQLTTTKASGKGVQQRQDGQLEQLCKERRPIDVEIVSKTEQKNEFRIRIHNIN